MCIHLWLWRRRLSLRPCACAQCRVLPLDLMQLLVAVKSHGTHARCSTKQRNKKIVTSACGDKEGLAPSLPQLKSESKCPPICLTVQCEGECLGRLARVGEDDAPRAHTVAQNLHQAASLQLNMCL